MNNTERICFLAYATQDACFNIFHVNCLSQFSYSSNKPEISRQLYTEVLRELSVKQIAFAYPHEGRLYFKGDQKGLIEKIEVLSKQYPNDIKFKDYVSTTMLNPKDDIKDLNITRAIIYSALRGTYAERISKTDYKSFTKRGYVQLFPKSEIKYLDQLGTYYVHYGLRILFEVSPRGYGVLWIDMLAPPISLENGTRQRISYKTLPDDCKNRYRQLAVINTTNRVKDIKRLVQKLTGDENTIKINLGNEVLTFRLVTPYDIRTETSLDEFLH